MTHSILLFGMPGGFEWIIIFMVLGIPLLQIIAIVDIIRSKFTDSNNKVIWILLVLFLPFLGALLYFTMGRKQRAIN